MEISTPILAALVAGGLGLFGVLANHRLTLHRDRMATLRSFARLLQEDLAALEEPRNNPKDAFSLLEQRFSTQYSSYITAIQAASPIQRIRMRKAWREYYGDETGEEAEWWLPNEYSTILSNQLKNTPENTKALARHRLGRLIRACA